MGIGYRVVVVFAALAAGIMAPPGFSTRPFPVQRLSALGASARSVPGRRLAVHDGGDFQLGLKFLW
jgi:hypothetical protein